MKKLLTKTYYLLIILFCFIAFPLLLGGCLKKAPAPISLSGFYFDTVISVTLYEEEQEPLLEECMALASNYEKLFSKTVDGSDVWRINHAKTAPTIVNEETAVLLQKALDYANLTDGLVDPSIGVLSSLWDFSSDTPKTLPDPASLSEALSHLNYKKIQLEGTTVTLTDPLTQIDLGFIAKGYIADKLKEYLIGQGVTSALINLGGNVLAIGQKPNGSPFTVGIQTPFAPTGTPLTSIPVTDTSVVTSGVYERYFYKNNVLYHHILDTKTGYPIENNLLSVTIISSASVDGDALSTACLALGLTKGSALIESLPDTEALFVTKDNALHPTSGLVLNN